MQGKGAEVSLKIPFEGLAAVTGSEQMVEYLRLSYLSAISGYMSLIKQHVTDARMYHNQLAVL